MKMCRSVALAIAAVVFVSAAGKAETKAPSVGAAEREGKAWPYPEPAQRGATGYSPDYSEFKRTSERWDIYVNILWRKTGSESQPDPDYYGYELTQFLETLPSADRAKFKGATQLLLVLEQVRAGLIQLPYRDPATGCLLFAVEHDTRIQASRRSSSSIRPRWLVLHISMPYRIEAPCE
jgi:hypothetical protein